MHTTLASNKEYTGFLLGESMGVLGAIQRKFIERLRTSNEQVTQQLAEVASILAIDPVSPKPFFELVNLPEVVAAAVSVEGPRLRKKKINLQVNLPDQTPALATDPDLLQQILQTILRHAGEVTPPQGVVWLRLVVEGESKNPDYVVFQIKDEGGGLPAEDLAIIFKPQTQENDLRGQEKGPTAKLIQANRWIEAIRGRFWADNDPGRGCSFNILLPITNPAETGADDAGGNR
jgi:signal transduction histidine kinase